MKTKRRHRPLSVVSIQLEDREYTCFVFNVRKGNVHTCVNRKSGYCAFNTSQREHTPPSNCPYKDDYDD
jgi:hypothetical protein